MPGYDDNVDAKWGAPHPLHDPYLLAHFQARPDDVLITTAAKAGTTWMQQILHQLRSGGDASFRNIDDVVPWLERPRAGVNWRQRLDQLDQMPSPRLFKTHCTFEQTPGFGVAKVILTSRDPRDCCVSFYHHIMNMTDEACAAVGVRRPPTFDAFFDKWMEFGAWFRNVKSWWPYHGHPRVLWLRYEDLVREVEPQVDRILAFLGWTLADERRRCVMEYCSFKWMKEHNEKFHTLLDSGASFFKPGQFVRKGAVGDHQSLLSQAQEQRILARVYDELAPDCVQFLNLPEPLGFIHANR